MIAATANQKSLLLDFGLVIAQFSKKELVCPFQPL